MKLIAMTTMLLVAGAAADSGSISQPAERTVTVCMEGGAPVKVDQARAIAGKMFAQIGVTLRWRTVSRGCPSQAIQISLSHQTPPTLLPGALAYALPYERTHIRLFYDRIMMNPERDRISYVIAHVLVHEITHILQGLNRHSASGIMKAYWDKWDLSQMTWKPLTFTEDDIDLIYKGLAVRATRAITANANGEPATVAAR